MAHAQRLSSSNPQCQIFPGLQGGTVHTHGWPGTGFTHLLERSLKAPKVHGMQDTKAQDMRLRGTLINGSPDTEEMSNTMCSISWREKLTVDPKRHPEFKRWCENLGSCSLWDWVGKLQRNRALPLPEGPARALQAQHMRKLLETRNGSPHTQSPQDHR